MNEPISNDTSSEHLLLAMAKTYPVCAKDLAPQGCQYDLFQGAWVLNPNPPKDGLGDTGRSGCF